MTFVVTALFAVVFLMSTVSAFADIQTITVNGIEHNAVGDEIDGSAGVFAGEAIPIRVTFLGLNSTDEVRIVSRLRGESGFSQTSERFDVLAGQTYSRLINFQLPYDLDDNREEDYSIEITIEANGGKGDSIDIPLQIQRSSFELQILAVETSNDYVTAGGSVAFDVVLKNRGRQEARDTFVRVNIPELGISKLAFLGDLTPVDVGGDEGPEEFDSDVVRVFVNIPQNAAPGVYNAEVEAFNDDSLVVANKRIVVRSPFEGSQFLSSTNTKTFGVGEEGRYLITVANSGNSLQIFRVVPEGAQGLSVMIDNPVVAVPAGSSAVVEVIATSDREGRYPFSVRVESNNGQVVATENFVADVNSDRTGTSANLAVVLTIILAVVFVVLLVVLVILLTKGTGKSEDLGESYY